VSKCTPISAIIVLRPMHCVTFYISHSRCAASDVFTQTVDAVPSSNSCVDEVELERLRSAHDDAVEGFELLKVRRSAVRVVVGAILMMQAMSIVCLIQFQMRLLELHAEKQQVQEVVACFISFCRIM
jgi:hypothetical protein